ncbi:MAG: FAD:protein FMN transferase [Ruminococcus sp.]|nr:FAD:protein FMN transferase [Ruminococcus sp.]
MFLALCLLCGCGRESNTVFLLDTFVTIDSDCNTEELTEVISEVSEAAEEYYDKPFSETDRLSDMFKKGEELRAAYGDEIDFRIGALTRLWNISKETPVLPSPEQIQAALADRSYADPGAIAKGYALDCAYRTLVKTKSKRSIISAESSILLYGEKPGGEPFKTAIKSPFIPGEFVGYIETGAAFISTSGNSERFIEIDGKRYGHIFDAKTGYPVETDLASVTVIVPAKTPDGGIMSDFLSTLIFMRGTEGLKEFEANPDFTFLAIDKNGDIYGNQSVCSI